MTGRELYYKSYEKLFRDIGLVFVATFMIAGFLTLMNLGKYTKEQCILMGLFLAINAVMSVMAYWMSRAAIKKLTEAENE
ncbi:MAG: hypothetical protein SPL30_07745 [Succinivibrio sp.]|jgi:hypothetical protein|nr:hypothetical protein [Succinivibrio sp.]